MVSQNHCSVASTKNLNGRILNRAETLSGIKPFLTFTGEHCRLPCRRLVTKVTVFFDRSLFQRGILERLNAGEVLVGDGGMTYALEKRGYVKAGPWTPECTVEHPEAGQLGSVRPQIA